MSLIAEKREIMSSSQKPWVVEGTHFEHGVGFRGKHKGYYYTAVVDNGALLVNSSNRRFISPTAAALSITRKCHLDGWHFWQCKLSDQHDWVAMNALKNGNHHSHLIGT